MLAGRQGLSRAGCSNRGVQAQRAAPSRPLRSRRAAMHCAAAATLTAAAPGKTALGFAGIGIMGHAMVMNLLKAGYEVHVWNRNPAKCDPLVASGAKVCKSPAELAAAADYTFAMLSDPEAALSVASREDGIVAGLSAGKGYVDVSTIDAETAQKIAGLVRGKGAAYLEAPVSGSKGPAEAGALIFLTGGDEALCTAVAGPLEVMGKKTFYLGDVGAGAKMKLVANMIMGSMLTSLGEGMALAEKSGLDQKDLLECLGLGAMSNPMFALKGPAMVDHKFPPAFPLKHQEKDLRLAIELGQQCKQPLPVASAAYSQYVRASSKLALGDSDFAAVYEAIVQS